MYFLYGSRPFGKVDEIEGVGHVATEFGHFFWFPLVPKESLLVLSEKWNRVEGIPIRMSMKSVGFAYARAVAFVFFLAAFGSAKALFAPEAGQDLAPERINNMWAIMLMGAVALPALIVSYTAWITQADYQTAVSLVSEAGLGPEVRALVDAAYGATGQSVQASAIVGGAQLQSAAPGADDCNLESAKYLKQYADV
ncbi:hypothetical protein Pla123a_38120 [Posidoniimonas polymericola]|uniref:Uncharacterized protein n=1 Tax=Posidoniimonas polymericola TaxID=2528002 RepID=A0A5C5YCQ4_9BACT|nr:hypothetical protein [Posidoniimonas polymericola]TWT73476.1 hypothetical protein Pla123a_38120 [Posidoniimonas polymericola]